MEEQKLIYRQRWVTLKDTNGKILRRIFAASEVTYRDLCQRCQAERGGVGNGRYTHLLSNVLVVELLEDLGKLPTLRPYKLLPSWTPLSQRFDPGKVIRGPETSGTESDHSQLHIRGTNARGSLLSA